MSFTLCEQLELVKLRHRSLALLTEIKAYAKAEMQQEDIAAALATIYQAMQNSVEVMQAISDQHRMVFVAQMRSLGASRLRADEPYLPGVLAQARLDYLQQLEALFEQVEAYVNIKSINDGSPILPQLESAIAKEKVRAETRLSQQLDEARQRSNGVQRYVWSTQRDGRVRPSHAVLDGQVFDWDGDGLKPGEEFGCRCIAEPVEINDPPLEPVYPEIALIPLLRLERAAAIILKRVGDKIKPSSEKPAEKPAENNPKLDITKRPEGVPKDWKATPTKDGKGVEYRDPNNSGTYVKVQKGNPNSSQSGQRYDNVRVQKNGKSYDVNGNEVPKQSQESHIPIEDFKFPEGLFK